MPVKPLAHVAQCISKLLPFETNLDLAHYWPALPETRLRFSNSQTAVRLRSVPTAARELALQLSSRPPDRHHRFPLRVALPTAHPPFEVEHQRVGRQPHSLE